MLTHSFANLPAELVILLLDYCADKPWSLALVNKHYNCNITPVLYGKIAVHTLRGTQRLSNTVVTGRPHLRNFVKELAVATYWDSVSDYKSLCQPLRALLLLVPNLSRLCVSVSEPATICLIEETQYPFTLQELSIAAVCDERFMRFLESQSQIKKIHLWPSDNSDQSIIPELNLNHILPHLKSIEAPTLWIQTLVPFSPVSSVTIDGLSWCVKLDELHIIGRALAQSSAHLTSLSFGLLLRAHLWHTYVLQALKAIHSSSSSLSEVEIRVIPRFIPRMKKSMLWLLEPDKTPSNAFELLRGGLAVFSDLKRFELKPSWAWERKIPPDFKEATPELSRFDLWTESCRSLEEVRLFGTVLRGA